jgi:hypothetical protein
VKVLITSSRMPFALGMVRKLAAEVYPSPRSDTAGFLAELERIVQEHEIDVIVPAFEEAFYISTQIERLSQFTKVFASPFRTLAQHRLHAKHPNHRSDHMFLSTAQTELEHA